LTAAQLQMATQEQVDAMQAEIASLKMQVGLGAAWSCYF
jgi:hypothetical protein